MTLSIRVLSIPRILLPVLVLAIPCVLLRRSSYSMLRRIVVVLQRRETLLLLLLVRVVVVTPLIRFSFRVAAGTEDFLQDVQQSDDEACHVEG